MFNLGRCTIRKASVTAVPAEDVEKKKGQHTVPPANADSASGQPESSAMATQTQTSTVSALTLAGMNTSKVASFLGRGLNTGSGNPPSGSGLSGGGPPRGPPGTGGSGGGMLGGGPPGSGLLAGGAGAGAAPGGGNSKLGGNPPTDFDSNQALVGQFMQEFNLYRITNIDAKQIGPNVKDWVKQWTNWSINKINTRRAPADKHFWNEVVQAFQQAFQDTGAREWAEDKLCHLVFTPGKVNTFITQFESLATEATYPINTQSTLLLFASKLPYRLMDHIYKVIRPINFQGWANGAQQFHQDNTAVQNIRGIYEDMPKKKSSKMTPHQLARMLGVPMPSQNPNAMDTRVDHSHDEQHSNKPILTVAK
ncbi:hypothetical protein EDB84DRAFT_1572132 [Lactarius hengduanensis]|nr:hypothetical protein EDB84DRAFT_1572132 [Lactarius hengduanensis]